MRPNARVGAEKRPTAALLAVQSTAGVAGKLFHDLRRTAARNMIRGSVAQSIAMRPPPAPWADRTTPGDVRKNLGLLFRVPTLAMME